MTTPYGIPPPDFRLPADVRLGRVRLQVGDVSRSVDYYERVLGLRVSERLGTGASLGPAGGGEVLVALEERRGATSAPRGGRLGLYHFAILLPDRPSLAGLARHLLNERVPMASADHAVSEALYLSDPDGLGIEVYADRPRAGWRHTARQLVMTSEPLDLRDLLAAGSGEPWAGMPAGTTMGHVHLHVGDLAEAEDFYHSGLGFDKTVWEFPGALFLSAGGYHHHLATNTWAAGASLARDDEARLLDWRIVLPDRAALERLMAHFDRRGLTTSEASGARVLRDPWGTAVSIATVVPSAPRRPEASGLSDIWLTD